MLRMLLPILIAATVLCGCSNDRHYQSLLKEKVRVEDRQFAEAILQQIRARQFEPIIKQSVQQLQNDKAAPLLDIIARYMNVAPLEAQDLVGWHVNRKLNQTTLYYQQDLGISRLLLKIVVSHQNAKPQLLNFDCQKLSYLLQDTHAFTFKQKTPSHFIMLALSILTPLFILITFIRCPAPPNNNQMVMASLYLGRIRHRLHELEQRSSRNYPDSRADYGRRPLSWQSFQSLDTGIFPADRIHILLGYSNAILPAPSPSTPPPPAEPNTKQP